MAQGKKNARRKRATIVFLGESGFSTTPSVRRTWAPRGKTPSLPHRFNWKRLSATGALATNHKGENVRLFLSLTPGSINSDRVQEFMRSLRRHIRGQVIIVWDGLPSHRSRSTTEFLSRQAHWLTVVRFPPQAPEPSPVEYLWGNARATYLANYLPDDRGELSAQVKRHARHVSKKTSRSSPCFPQAFRAFLSSCYHCIIRDSIRRISSYPSEASRRLRQSHQKGL
ncbi:MAG: transposase [Actinobacteria bacterium]|nr:transposase [Actinomycetota bacterium]MBU4219241.1 transposase [Actinomycetota bacterium]MBU4359498.1 transposase [Actinomycetota bacterium]MBU4392888.1 transposase [Actinomycetota bacterium]MBU4403519.1 transposase [Actinomycetota bacterium]